MKLKKQSLYALIGGLGVGVINGLLGTGGGLLAVPLLRKSGLSTKQSHASSIAVILPLSVLSTVLYFMDGRMTFTDPLIFIPFGLIGAGLGAKFVRKMNDRILRGLFGVFMLWAGFRLFMR